MKKDPSFDLEKERRRTSATCSCKSDCSTKRCKCKKGNGFCDENCKCDITKCANRAIKKIDDGEGDHTAAIEGG